MVVTGTAGDGKTMAQRRVATVFGGAGFLGRFVVKRLRREGYVVRVATRDTERVMGLRTRGPTGEIVPIYATFREPGTIRRAVLESTVVVNLIGILAEKRPGDFHKVHAEGAETIAREARAAGVEALAHVSAIGADAASDSAYGRSKAEGERLVAAAFPGAAILRPSLVFGPDDKFFNRFAGMARLSPVMPVFFGDTLMQPVYAGDVADAIAAVLERRRAGVVELGGPDVMSFRDILRWILAETHRRRPLLEIPGAVAFLQAAFAERVPGKPLTRDQLRMLRHDNVVGGGAAGFAELGITPASIDLIVPGYLARFRPGGGRQRVPA